MTTVAQTLLLVGAAEGSYYSSGKAVDLRYFPSTANARSGVSFGTFQFDVATNDQAKLAMIEILRQGVLAKVITQSLSNELFRASATRNAKVFLNPLGGIEILKTLLITSGSKAIIDSMDRQRAMVVADWIDTLISNAANKWVARGKIGSNVFLNGSANYLRLFAYFLASLNRYPNNYETFKLWLEGDRVTTLHSPTAGFKLDAPPTIEQMHIFLKSLRIWDGSQGKYSNLHARLESVLSKLGA